MGFNIYNQIKKVQESLNKKGYSKNIPIHIFGTELMLLFGMGQKKAIEWIGNFEKVGLIKRDGNNINFV